MKYLLTLSVLLAALTGFAADTSGIKTANLKGADVSLMNDHDPEVERQHLDTLPGFQVNLFASEPMIANPLHMTWDARGRLWVVCSWAYPQLKPGDEANDKIIILEDTDGDGKADKSTVFADGLYVPTGIALAHGGCYVGQSPDVFLLKDTDGDDVADVKELALTGFGIEDSHHSISAWRRGSTASSATSMAASTNTTRAPNACACLPRSAAATPGATSSTRGASLSSSTTLGSTICPLQLETAAAWRN
jgi:glucose/arabinose dehydrogenase